MLLLMRPTVGTTDHPTLLAPARWMIPRLTDVAAHETDRSDQAEDPPITPTPLAPARWMMRLTDVAAHETDRGDQAVTRHF